MNLCVGLVTARPSPAPDLFLVIHFFASPPPPSPVPLCAVPQPLHIADAAYLFSVLSLQGS